MCDSNPTIAAWQRMLSALMATGLLVTVPLAASSAASQERVVPDRYVATTTNMTPDGLTLSIDVKEWSSDEARAAVIEAIQSDNDVAAAMRELPSVGVVWREGSGVGHSLKYAHRRTADDGSEIVTFVTDTRLDKFSFKPWEITHANVSQELPYSVIELRLGADGESGAGTLAMAADVELDLERHLVGLEAADPQALVLSDARLEPKPYWASNSE